MTCSRILCLDASVPFGPSFVRVLLDGAVQMLSRPPHAESRCDVARLVRGATRRALLRGMRLSPEVERTALSTVGNLRDRVTGFVPDEDLAPIYSRALMFVYPSLYEGFGLPRSRRCSVASP